MNSNNSKTLYPQPVWKRYFSLVKFSHTIFAMPFALIGFSLAIAKKEVVNPKPWWELLILVILCMVFARSAAMAFNRWLDAKYDALNARTAIREIPQGLITPANAILFVLFNCIAFIVCCYLINSICFWLSFVALFIVLFYSYTKRFTSLCHLVLGIGLSLAPIGAFLAVSGHFEILPLLFSGTVLFWVSGFDIIYALQDEDFDKQHDLWSIPAVLGKKRALGVSSILHVASAICIIGAGVYGHFGICYWIGVTIFIGMLFYQHSVVKPQDLSRVNLAFMTANGIASVIFSVFVLLDLFFSIK